MKGFNDLSHNAQWIIVETIKLADIDLYVSTGQLDFKIISNGEELDLEIFGESLEQAMNIMATDKAKSIAITSAMVKNEVDHALYGCKENLELALSYVNNAIDKANGELDNEED